MERGMISCVLAALLFFPGAALAAESYDNCTGFIDSVPAVISTQGTWCLRQDLSTGISSGSAITIATSNVTLDCNDFKLGGLAAGVGTQAKGVSAFYQVNLTVRHCNVRGFEFGLHLTGYDNALTAGHIVEDNRLDGNTYVAMRIEGNGTVVRRNLVSSTGGSQLSGPAGIVTVGSADILDNRVTGVVAQVASGGSAIGINSMFGVGGRINDNGVQDVVGAAQNPIGISLSFVERASISDNDVSGLAAAGGFGIACSGSSMRARDNIVNGFGLGLAGCSNDGGNIITP